MKKCTTKGKDLDTAGAEPTDTGAERHTAPGGGTTAGAGGKMDFWEWSDAHTKRFHDFNNRLADVGSYSDFVNLANEYTKGWYGTVADALPVAGNIHRAVLARDRTDDILNNTGQSWGDVIGYNSGALTAGTSAPVAGLTKKMDEGTHDLFEFYTGAKDQHRINSLGKIFR